MTYAPLTPTAVTPTSRTVARQPGRWRRSLIGAPILAATILLAGCAPSTPALSAEVSEQLQNDIVALANAAAAGDTAGAQGALAVLETRLAEGLAANTITADRGESIQAAVELVRADLTAMTEPEVEPTPSETPAPVETTPEEETPSVTPTPVAPVQPTTPPSNSGNQPGNGNSPGNGNTTGPGNGNGPGGNNGNGNGNENEPDENEPDENEPDENE